MNISKLILCLVAFNAVTFVADAKTNTAEKASKDSKSSKVSNSKDTKTFNKIKSMYAEFSKLISDGVDKAEMKKFFDKYFDEPSITKSFIGSKHKDEKLIDSFISYCVHLLKGEIISQVKDYSISDDFSQIDKKITTTFQCKLTSKTGDPIDLSVVTTNKKGKIKDLIFMKNVQLVGGARSIFKKYCEDNNKTFKKMKAKERSEIFQKAMQEYINGANNKQTSK